MDVLAPQPRRPLPATVDATQGLWVEHRGSSFVGVVEHAERREVSIRDDSGLLRVFPLTPGGFRTIADGQIVTLRVPVAIAPAAARFTPSGAVATPRKAARVARTDRILVEGTHDAELLEKIWGDELRPEGIVVEPIGGADNLAREVRARRPGRDQRLGVLLDHLVPGSKESRFAAQVAGPFVRVEGHAFVDVWQGVRPQVIGLRRWPEVPRGQPWKEGICRALAVAEPAVLWRQILRRVSTYADLDPSLVGAVERLLDFLLTPE